MKKIKNGIAILAIVGGLAGILIAAWNLVSSQMEYKKEEDAYEEILDDYVVNPKEPDEKKDPAEKGIVKLKEYKYLDIDFLGLMEMNSDIIAWIDVPGVGISYPVLQGKDNSYYLTHLSNGADGIHGSVFVDFHNEPHFMDQNTIIYGHNMKDGTMFAPLDNYWNEGKYLEDPYFYIYTPKEVLIYKIYSCYEGSSSGVAYTYGFSDEDSFREFLNETRDSSLYETVTGTKVSDRIVTLSTCVNTSRQNRFIVHGVLWKSIKE